MKHFIGGWALGAIAVGGYLFSNARLKLGDALIVGIVVGLFFAFAAWGLLS